MSNREWIILISLSIILIALLHFLTPTDKLLLHQIYERLYYIPIGFAAFKFGWRGGVLSAIFAGFTYFPHIFFQWRNSEASLVLDQYVEIAVFFVFGLVTGLLGDRLRSEKDRAEKINIALQRAYSELRETTNQLIKAERITSLVEMASTVVHEIRNPLSSIKGAIEILEADVSEERMEFAKIAKREIERLDNIVQSFFDFSRSKNLNKQKVQIDQVISEVVTLIKEQAELQRVQLSYNFNSDLPMVDADPNQVKQVLLNLAVNSLQAMPEGGHLKFRACAETGYVIIEVEDTGGGIPKEIAKKIFEPFFSTKQRGLGLGLTIAHKIMTGHGGNIEFLNTDTGVKFILRFPI
jgi:signal transduction histidine kinase